MLLRAWKQLRQEQRLKNAIGRRAAPLQYCVKYSEFCKCLDCLSSRTAEADILPTYYPVGGHLKTPPLAALYHETTKPSSVSIKVGGRDLSAEETQTEQPTWDKTRCTENTKRISRVHSSGYNFSFSLNNLTQHLLNETASRDVAVKRPSFNRNNSSIQKIEPCIRGR